MTAARKGFLERGWRLPERRLPGGTVRAVRYAVVSHLDAAERAGGAARAWATFPKPHLVVPAIVELADSPEITESVGDVLGEAFGIWSSAIFVSPPGTGTGFGWHQDALSYDLDGDEGRALRVWVALTPATPENGTMWFADGSHRCGTLDHDLDDPVRGQSVSPDRVPGEKFPVVLDEGGFSMHDLRLAHSSGRNTTDGPRINVALDYVAPEAVPGAGCAGVLPLTAGFQTPWRVEPDPRKAAAAQAHEACVTESARRLRSAMDLAARDGLPLVLGPADDA
uniref:Phytanoyl-CoA dioxygenase-like hydroxylase n=1 Tax=Streptomyces olivoviridis TaxID=67338 RepID=T2HV91_9ACTN|nr:putative phytanoyl-CoA dioxygenase family protein [Streptomyces olivoviridis]BBI93410.1 phytanoyl-CoA dioxygenase-like hydroxylase [Streptomyces olivoviridis]